MPQQAPISPQTLHEKMNAGYPKRVTGGSSGSVVTTSNDTTIVTEQVTASVLFDYNVTLSGLQTGDGIDCVERELVIANGQTDATQNGIYYMNSGAWTRHSQPIYGGLTVAINKGFKYGDTLWQAATPDGKAEKGVDVIRFEEVSASKAIRESEKSAAGKMAVLMRMIYNLKRELLCKINDRYEVICHASSFAAGVWSAVNGVSTVVPFNTLVYTPTDGSFALGEFTAGRSGYYDVDVYLFNQLLVAPPGALVYLQIAGSLDIYDCDSRQINTERFYLQGSRKVWCAKGGKIYAAVRHDQATPIDINSVAAPGADGYISISYAGTGRAANHS